MPKKGVKLSELYALFRSKNNFMERIDEAVKKQIKGIVKAKDLNPKIIPTLTKELRAKYTKNLYLGFRTKETITDPR